MGTYLGAYRRRRGIPLCQLGSRSLATSAPSRLDGTKGLARHDVATHWALRFPTVRHAPGRYHMQTTCNKRRVAARVRQELLP